MSSSNGMVEEGLLVPIEEYFNAAVNIGTQQKTKQMFKYVYKVRPDGLYLIDVHYTDKKIKDAAKLLARYDPSKILAVSTRVYGQRPVAMFARATGAKSITGRFIPGTLTNFDMSYYIEPDILIATDPFSDQNAVKEAKRIGIPIIALCDTNNDLADIDLVIPTNNKGKSALALVYYLLSKNLLRQKGIEKFDYKLSDFEYEDAMV